MFFSLAGMVTIFSTILYLAIPNSFVNEEYFWTNFRGTTLEHLTNKGLPVHWNSLNDRVSAHYTEINSLYELEMMKRVIFKLT